MPIKYQALGGSDGSIELTIKTSKPNTKITITKESFKKVLFSNDSLLAFCKLPWGTYIIKAEYENEVVSQKEITISKQKDADLRESKLAKDLPIGAKFKFSNGKTYTVQLKNKQTVQFISDFALDEGTRTSEYFNSGTVYEEILPKYYDELTWYEKESVARYDYPCQMYDWESGAKNYIVTLYFAVPSNEELNGLANTQKARKFKNGANATYWTRNGWSHDDGRRRYYYIETDGSLDYDTYNRTQRGVVPVFNVKNETVLVKDHDGYWVIAE